MLKKLCHALDIPWREEMLSWKKGRQPEDGVWAAHWYASVEETTGFAPYKDREISLKPELTELMAEQVPYFDALRAHKI